MTVDVQDRIDRLVREIGDAEVLKPLVSDAAQARFFAPFERDLVEMIICADTDEQRRDLAASLRALRTLNTSIRAFVASAKRAPVEIDKLRGKL